MGPGHPTSGSRLHNAHICGTVVCSIRVLFFTLYGANELEWSAIELSNKRQHGYMEVTFMTNSKRIKEKQEFKETTQLQEGYSSKELNKRAKVVLWVIMGLNFVVAILKIIIGIYLVF